MSFPTVKTDDWDKPLTRPRRGRSKHLWPDEWWGRLTRQAKRDIGKFDAEEYPISDRCVAMIVEFNAAMRDLAG